jgi:single-stranded-DNA-specific exonuclease
MAIAAARWTCTPYSVAGAERLARELGASLPLATALVRRGVDTVEAARSFLAADERHDPFEFAGMDAACESILTHVRAGSPIVVHGDYDVDGACSTTILINALRALGADPSWHIPARDDGYGLSVATIQRLAAAGARLIVTADCAITSVEEVARARELGVDVVVTDHHRPGERLPRCPIVHPAVSGYPFADLCAAGVAQKLSEALLRTAGADPAIAAEDADLVALATIADVVPLRAENRRLVRDGLKAITRTRKAGLRALMAVAQLDPGAVDERSVAFRLAPRINAAGRLARADAALELLLTEDPARAERIADELDRLNRERQDVETRILFAAEAARAEHPDAPAYVLAGQGWHPGVIGIVASRMVERHHRPCVLITLDGDRGRGSGRSIAAYDLHAGLDACSEHLLRYGGHRAAAGLEIASGEVEAFRDAFVRHAAGMLSPEDLVPVERVDAVVGPDRLGVPLAEELQALRPFGHGNRAPVFLVPAARVADVRSMGDESQHSRFTLAGAAGRARAVAFRTAAASLPASREERCDAAVQLELNEWNGTVEPRLVVRALCPTERGSCTPLRAEPPFMEVVIRELDGSGLQAPRPPDGPPARAIRDRRGEGFAGVAGDLLSSGESVAIVCADSTRRREGLEQVIGGIGPAAFGSWDDLLEEPELARPFGHLVALDPPIYPAAVEALAGSPAPEDGLIHLAWGPAEVDFALAVARSELELRPIVTVVYRALHDLGEGLLADVLEATETRPRSPRAAGRALRVLVELGIAAVERRGATALCRVLPAERTELDRSATYRACRARMEAAEARLRSAPARAA